MATPEASVISSVCETGDIHVILGEDAEIFGPFGDAFEFMKDYYLKYKSVPGKQLLEERFGDMNLPDSTGNAKFHMEELRNSFVRNRMEQIMDKAQSALNNSGESPSKLLEKLNTSLAKVGKYTTSARDLDITNLEAAEEHFRNLRQISEANNGVPGIPMGYKSIDSAYTTGMAPGHSIIFIGYTGRGKSLFAENIALQAWDKGAKVMIVSLEMTPEEQMERIYTQMASGRFKHSDLSRGDVAIDDLHAWGKKRFDGKNKMIVVSNQGMSVVTPNIVQAKIDTHRPDLVILDYMQLMMDNGKSQQMTQRMMNLSREIKLLANANNIPIISLSAVTDEDGDKRDSPPLLSQVSWSHAIEYDANLVIAVHMHPSAANTSNVLIEIVARKQRNGPLFNFYLDVDIDRGIWTEKFHI